MYENLALQRKARVVLTANKVEEEVRRRTFTWFEDHGRTFEGDGCLDLFQACGRLPSLWIGPLHFKAIPKRPPQLTKHRVIKSASLDVDEPLSFEESIMFH